MSKKSRIILAISPPGSNNYSHLITPAFQPELVVWEPFQAQKMVWTNRIQDGWTDGQMDFRTDGQIEFRTDGRIEFRTDRIQDEWTNRLQEG